MGSQCLLRAEDLCFERDDLCVIDHFNFELNPGDILQVEGSNGSGKTTLLSILSTTVHSSSGRILSDEKELPDTSSTTNFEYPFTYPGGIEGAKAVKIIVLDYFFLTTMSTDMFIIG